MSNKWLDPTKYKDDADFIRAYNHAHAKALAFQEIIDLIDKSEQRIADIETQLKMTEKNYEL